MQEHFKPYVLSVIYFVSTRDITHITNLVCIAKELA